MNFSMRKKITQVSNVIQTDSMTVELRNSLWSVLHECCWSLPGYLNGRYSDDCPMNSLCKLLWYRHFKKPIDTIPVRGEESLKVLRDYFFECPWNEVYDFIEAVILSKQHSEIFVDLMNAVLESESSGYRIIGGMFSGITSKEEIDLIDDTLSSDTHKGVQVHFKRAFEMLTDKKQIDYRNSIKESISALESLCRSLLKNKNATLGDALNEIKKKKIIHKALLSSFSSLYGYASDENGIRHGMLDEPNIGFDDAKYILVSTMAFVHYLKSKCK